MINKYALLKVIRGIIRENKEFSLRDVARKVKIGPSTAKETLDYLMSQNILDMRIVGKNHLFKVKSNVLTNQIKILYTVFEIESSGIIEELIKKIPDILSIAIYGSTARGDDDDKSDIDLLVIVRKKSNIPTLKNEKFLSRELSITIYTYKEWKDKAEKDKIFYYNVISNSITIYGEKPIVI
ncbi:MAG: nucleotidyltransferase domain-containing protein [Nanoarchaeota archaeon]